MFNDRSNSSRRGRWKGRTQCQKVVPNATPTVGTEILGVYGSSTPICSANTPPRKKGSMLNAGEGTSMVRAKRLNVVAFGEATLESVNIRPFGPNLKCSFPYIQHVSPLSRGSID
ncbi:hypothetical protein H5410_015515 [Solanum commersonii]|uniref:Uncharacterized protein n=1 Tax=Solanum commersonii TaxID=4109 RepID=A0A9J5ZUB6_SOLCO|nr:hypothetical protein H5410_015515 [Solanum commersonii]